MLDATSLERGAWPIVGFGEVVRNQVRTVVDPIADGIERYVGLEHLDGRDLRLRRWGRVADGSTFTRVFEPGEVLFGKRRAYQRKAAVADFRGVCSGDLLVFSPAGDELLPEFLPFVVSSDGFVEYALATSAGSLSPRTRWKDLATYSFRLPPRDVQRRIASLGAASLDQADAFEVAADRASVLARAGVATELLSDSRWSTFRLDDVLTRSPEAGHSAPKSPRDTGHWVLGLQAISRHGYVPGQVKPVEPTEEMLSARLHSGDLLVTRSNTPSRVGFAGIYREERDDVSFPDTMMRLEVDRDRVLPEFIAAMIMSPLGRRHMLRVAAGTSASMKKINRRTLGSFEFPLPPLSAQQEMLKKYGSRQEAAGALRTVAGRAVALVDALRREVLEP